MGKLKTVYLTEEENDWLEANDISFSKFVKNKIKEQKEKKQ
jgi:hypothetical protein